MKPNPKNYKKMDILWVQLHEDIRAVEDRIQHHHLSKVQAEADLEDLKLHKEAIQVWFDECNKIEGWVNKVINEKKL